MFNKGFMKLQSTIQYYISLGFDNFSLAAIPSGMLCNELLIGQREGTCIGNVDGSSRFEVFGVVIGEEQTS